MQRRKKIKKIRERDSLLYRNIFKKEDVYEAGNIFYDRESGRYNFHCMDEDGARRDYGGIHCGEVFEFCLNDVWVPGHMEMGMDDRWNLVGLPRLTLDGLEVRQGRDRRAFIKLYYRYNDKSEN